MLRPESFERGADAACGEAPVLGLVADDLQRDEFENQTRSHRTDETFQIQSYDPLNILPGEMLLLHFTDR